MAIATAYYSVNMDTASVWYGDVTIANSNLIQIADGGYVQNYYGAFTYNYYGLTGGTVTSTNYYEFGSKIYEITGGNYSALTIESYLDYGNMSGLLAFVFSGNDTFNGSAQADALNGFSGNDNIRGNGGNDILKGSTGNDTLDGGVGADIMLGGLGDDTYTVDSTGDVVTEGVNSGIDTVNSNISYTLGANLEKLILTGTAAINGTGNTLNNTLTGNSDNNILNGMAGNDTMLGGLGNDTYLVNAAGDVVTEGVNQGIDTVKSTISYTLGANMEKLILTGATVINGTGNILANILTGNNGVNALNGMAGDDTILGGMGNDYLNGGLGNDRLTGGFGKDTFLFNKTLDAATNLDRIEDFIAIDDTIKLDQTVFSSLSTLGSLSGSGCFRSSTNGMAADNNDYILYNRTTGVLLYDADGNGTGVAAIQFATLAGMPNITAADFIMVA